MDYRDRYYVEVDGVKLPYCSSDEPSYSDIANEARNAEGVMIGEFVRRGVYKTTKKWNAMKEADAALVAALLNAKGKHSVTLWDLATQSLVTRTMYCSDRSFGKLFRCINGEFRYIEVKISFIEV
jgi:hypothetical protein